MHTTLFSASILVLLLTGCISPRKSQQQFKEPPMENLHVGSRESSANKIIFLTFRITLTDSTKDTYLFTLKNTVLAEGTLNKNSFITDIPVDPYHLYCEISDDHKKRVDMIKVQNPLSAVFEYSPDKKTLEKKVFISKSGEFFLRFQLTKNSKYLTIYLPQPDLTTLKKIYHAQI